MSILIKGFEMPKDCPMCPMSHWNRSDEFTGCEVVAGMKYAVKTDHEYMESSSRPDWCPLVPVPPHGDLIDLKAPFKAQYYDEMTEEWLETMVTVEDALYGCMVDEMPPTVIPAEEGE